MLCDDVRRVVYFFLDGSLADSKKQDLSSHVSVCPDCDQRITLHRRLRNFVRRRLSPIAAPERLKLRVTRTLRAMVAD
jgi:anti-sigma factor (TIGR02949 family)